MAADVHAAHFVDVIGPSVVALPLEAAVPGRQRGGGGAHPVLRRGHRSRLRGLSHGAPVPLKNKNKTFLPSESESQRRENTTRARTDKGVVSDCTPYAYKSPAHFLASLRERCSGVLHRAPRAARCFRFFVRGA